MAKGKLKTKKEKYKATLKECHNQITKYMSDLEQ